MVRRSPLFSVPAPDVDPVMQEVAVRVKATKTIKTRTYDPSLGSTPEEAEERLAVLRTDIGEYGEYVFGLRPAPVHKLWNRIASDVIYGRIRQNKVLFIAPPQSAKSTWNSLIRPCFHLGQNPDQSILFFTSSDPMAKIFHTPVEAALRSNERHRYVFDQPEARPDMRRGWSSDGLYLKGTPAASKDPSYKAVGFGATIMGARANGLIVDDPLDQDEAESEPVRNKAKKYSDRTITPRMKIGAGWMIAIMTRWHEDDLAAHYIKLAKDSGDWLYVRTPMIATNEPEPDPLGRATGELLWPDYMTEAFVEETQRRLTIAEFNLIYQGDPTGMGGDIFEEEGWFQGLPANFWSDIFPHCFVVQGWDLAFSKNKRTCFTVCVTVAVDQDLNMYIIHVIRDRYDLGGVEDVMVRSAQILKPLVCGVEIENFHKKTTEALCRRVLKRVMVNIQLVQADKDKIARARLPASRAKSGMVFVNKDATWYRSLVSECLGFPNTTYKDQVDAFSLCTHIVEQLGQLREKVRQHARRQMVEHALA